MPRASHPPAPIHQSAPRRCHLQVHFNETFDLDHSAGASSVIDVSIMDKKQIGTDEPIGRGYIDLSQFLPAPGRSFQTEVPLVRHGESVGVVNVRLQKFPDRSEDPRSPLSPTYCPSATGVSEAIPSGGLLLPYCGRKG